MSEKETTMVAQNLPAFLVLNELVERNEKVELKAVIVNLDGIDYISEYKSGGAKIVFRSGKEIRTAQTPVTIAQVLPVNTSLFAQAPSKLQPAPIIKATVPVPEIPIDAGADTEGTEEDEAPAEVVDDSFDEADILATCTSAALTLIKEHGVNVRLLVPNNAGKIGRPEVEKYLKTVKVEEEKTKHETLESQSEA